MNEWMNERMNEWIVFLKSYMNYYSIFQFKLQKERKK